MFTRFWQGMWFNAEHFVEHCMKTIQQNIRGNAVSLDLNNSDKKKYIYYQKRKNVPTLFRQCKEGFCKRFMIVARFSYNYKLKIRKVGFFLLTQNTIKRMIYPRHLQKKFRFFIPITFIEFNFINFKQQIILWKLLLHFLKNWKLIKKNWTHTFSIYHAKSPNISPVDYCVFSILKWVFSKLKSKNDSGMFWQNGNQRLWKFYEKPFHHWNHDTESKIKAIRLNIEKYYLHFKTNECPLNCSNNVLFDLQKFDFFSYQTQYE